MFAVLKSYLLPFNFVGLNFPECGQNYVAIVYCIKPALTCLVMTLFWCSPQIKVLKSATIFRIFCCSQNSQIEGLQNWMVLVKQSSVKRLVSIATCCIVYIRGSEWCSNVAVNCLRDDHVSVAKGVGGRLVSMMTVCLLLGVLEAGWSPWWPCVCC